ncbi:MAG: fibronectin type III domain-containing protein [Armatimonadota bacterium]
MEPLEWAFTIDHARDEQPPSPPVVSYVPARVADANDFEADTGGWGNFVAGQVLRFAEGGATGPGCVELRHLGGRGSGFVLVRDFGEGWREHPVVRFRYHARRAARGGLKVFGTTFDGTKDRWTELGALHVSGDGWQTAVVDVEEALARTDPSLDIHRIFLSIDLPPDGTLVVDDYAMYSQASHEASFRWAEPADASGVAGYSWVLGSADDTVPPEEITGTATEVTFTDLAPGQYYFHLRARDNAGNWGATARIPFELKAAQ